MNRFSILISVISTGLVLCPLSFFQVRRVNFVRISCPHNDGKSLKSEIPSPFLQLSAIRHLNHFSIFWHFLLYALMWLNLWYIVGEFSQWQDLKMPDTSLLVPLKLSLSMFLFDTNYSWSVGGKPDPIDFSNFYESWEVNSSFAFLFLFSSQKC